jgi:glycosyltransferase involved in cell wall biosynthesis
MLVEAFRQICSTRKDIALVIAGDGPYLGQMKQSLADLPAYFLGVQSDATLQKLLATSDLLAFPSCTDTLGSVVMEAQASGLPVLVADEGGPHEMMDDGLTGIVLPGSDSAAWAHAIQRLLDDEAERSRMSRTAPHRMARFKPAATFDSFWQAHLPKAPEPATPAMPELQAIEEVWAS